MRNLTEVILGGPGAGKTAELLRLTQRELKRGIKPERVAFLAFTKAAALEARERASADLLLVGEQLHWFRTLHSACFEVLGLRRQEVMQRRHWADLGELLGLTFGKTWNPLEGAPLLSPELGDQLRALHQLAGARRLTPRELWELEGLPVPWEQVERFESAYAHFKTDLGLLDFNDMLRRFIELGEQLPVEVAVVDEAQDLTKEQWEVLEVALAGARRVYIAGDDDQAIYQWAGAAIDTFLALAAKPRVLPRSRRLPQRVFDLATRVVGQIERRYQKAWRGTAKVGRVEWVTGAEFVDLSQPGTWLLLARNRYLLKPLARACREQGVPYLLLGTSALNAAYVETIRRYEALRAGKALPWEALEDVVTAMALPPLERPADEPGRCWRAKEVGLVCSEIWHDALRGIELDEREFYLACLRRGESLTKPPRVRVSTIHGAKGAEADHVVLSTDLSAQTWGAYQESQEAEHRVFYVGLTRARESLYLVEPQTTRAYALPQ